MESELNLVQNSLGQLMSRYPTDVDAGVFAKARFDHGLAWVWFGPGEGGLGVQPALQELVVTTIARAGYPEPPANGLGSGMAGPTLYSYGSSEQRSQWLERIFCSGDRWCQLFSEPGAGSDIASLATQARRHGDLWLVSGQKVWTSGAQHSDWGLLVARHDPDVPKHRGLTFFVLNMRSPGVEVRPLPNIAGHAEFNEVFLTNVAVPDSMRVGDVGDGWKVLLATLMNERLVFTSGGGPPDSMALIPLAFELWKDSTRNPIYRDRLVQAWIRTEVARVHGIRAARTRTRGVPGHEGSIGKIAMTELNQVITDLTIDLLGPAGTVLREPYGYRSGEGASSDPVIRFLRSRANTIEGGTSEVHRNNIGEHVLGLPAEPRTDKNLPWTEVPRS